MACPAAVWFPPLAADGCSYSGAPDINEDCVLCVHTRETGNVTSGNPIINNDVINGHMPFFFFSLFFSHSRKFLYR